MTIRLKHGAAGGVLGLVLVLAAWIIVPFEGDKRQAYTDIAGVATACLGHTGADIESGQHYSEAQCQAWFATDLGQAARGVQRCIKVPLRSYQWAAFTSTAYNIGVRRFCESSIASAANVGDLAAACAAIELYVFAKRQRLNGLVRHRAAERAMCEGRT